MIYQSCLMILQYSIVNARNKQFHSFQIRMTDSLTPTPWSCDLLCAFNCDTSIYTSMIIEVQNSSHTYTYISCNTDTEGKIGSAFFFYCELNSREFARARRFDFIIGVVWRWNRKFQASRIYRVLCNYRIKITIWIKGNTKTGVCKVN